MDTGPFYTGGPFYPALLQFQDRKIFQHKFPNITIDDCNRVSSK